MSRFIHVSWKLSFMGLALMAGLAVMPGATAELKPEPMWIILQGQWAGLFTTVFDWGIKIAKHLSSIILEGPRT